MDEIGTATLSAEGEGQVVHLPEGFTLPGDQVQVRRVASGLMLEPMRLDETESKRIFAELAGYRDVPFMPEGRQQPDMPKADDVDLDR